MVQLAGIGFHGVERLLLIVTWKNSTFNAKGNLSGMARCTPGAKIWVEAATQAGFSKCLM